MDTSSLSTKDSRHSASRAAALLEKRAAYRDFVRAARNAPEMQRLLANNHAYRHVLRFALNCAMFAGFALVATAAFHVHFALGMAVYPIYVFFQALVITGLLVHSHELSHGHIKTKWLNDLLGIASGLPGFVNFYSFKQAHRFHHKNIGNLDTPEAGAPVSPTGQKQILYGDAPRKLMIKAGVISPYLWFLVTWPIFVATGDYCSWLLPYRVRNGVDRKSLAVFVLFVLVNGFAFVSAPLAYVFLYLLPMTLGGNRIIGLTFLHHAHEDSVFFGAEHHSPSTAIMFSTDRDYGALIDFFIMNNGYHIPHHTFPSIAYYDLKRASAYLRATIPAELHYNFLPNSSLYRDFANGQYNNRLTEHHDAYQIELEAKAASPALHEAEGFAHA